MAEGRKSAATAAKEANGKALLTTGTRLLAFAAHPDDLEYYVGGSLAAYAARGGHVTAVLATDGERGGSCAFLGAVRREEQQRAAQILGYREVRFLGLPDRGLRYVQHRLFQAIEEVLRNSPAEVVLSFDGSRPMPPYIHADHVAVGRAVMAACDRVDRHPALYLFHTRAPDTIVDVTAFWHLKLEALRAYQSQSRGDQLPQGFRLLWRIVAGSSGFPMIPRRETLRRVMF